MSTVVLSAASPRYPSLERISGELSQALAAIGETEVRTFDLASMPLAHCLGEFDCWAKSPGACRAKDAETEIAKAVHDASRVVLLDAVTFGGHSSTLKRAQDRLLCLLSPFFEKRALLTHHAARYDKAPSLHAVGWMPRIDEAEVETFLQLADANAINLISPRVGAVVVDDTSSPEARIDALQGVLVSEEVPGARLVDRASLRAALFEAAKGEYSTEQMLAPSRVAFLVGSSKPKGTSVSERLAASMAQRFEREGLGSEVHFVAELQHENARTSAELEAIASADLLVLVTPLYWDALPALTTLALERIAALRASGPKRGKLAALVNCGFPEPEHARVALRIACHFASRAHYHLAGGLALGAGGMVGEGPIDTQRGPMDHVKRALDSAVHALARGENIPEAAIEGMADKAISDALYRFLGGLGWRYQAYKNGIPQSSLTARPLDTQ
jgi:multimeric flavodoxin WrbA